MLITHLEAQNAVCNKPILKYNRYNRWNSAFWLNNAKQIELDDQHEHYKG